MEGRMDEREEAKLKKRGKERRITRGPGKVRRGPGHVVPAR